jgi:hypothetical protein
MYYIPRGIVRSARVRKGYRDLIMFNQADRYSMKKETG